jgi:hypothetical protein
MKSASPGSRGCGDARPGTYLLGGMAAGGTLAPVTLCAGTMTEDDDWNLRWEVEPQLMHWVDAERTFDTRRLWYLDSSYHDRQRGDYTGSAQQQIKNLGPYGLMHHVGKTYYTPMAHMLETSVRGPSLRIDPRIAAQVSKFLPMRIFFVFPELPYFDLQDDLDGTIAEMRELEPVLDAEGTRWATIMKIPLVDMWAKTTAYHWDADRGTEPTWGHSDWGGTTSNDNGLKHTYLKLLSYLERHKLQPRKTTLDSGVLYYSWITRAVEYVAEEDVEKRVGRPVGDEELETLDHTEFLSTELAAAVQAGEANVEAVVLKKRQKGQPGYDYPIA